MLRHGIQQGSAQLLARLPQISLLSNLPGSSSSSSSIWPRAAQQGISSTAAAANDAEPAQDVPDVRKAARELGLDAVPLSKLKEMMADALPQDRPGLLEVPRAPPKQKKLGYADLQGYQELLESLVVLPESHAADMPKAPMLDAGQWLDTHFKQEGYGFEPRSPFYLWRAWAAAALPLEQAQTLVAMEAVMADDAARAALLKQAQHELARLWDWQDRRVALGLPPDLPHSSSSSSSTTPDAAAAELESAAAAHAAAAEAETAAAAAAAAELQEAELSGSSSSSGSDDELAAALSADELAEKGMLELLQTSGALSEASEAEKFEDSLQGSDAASSSSSSSVPAAGSVWMHVENVVSDSAAEKAAAIAAAEGRIQQRLADRASAATTAKVVQSKLERGQQTAEKGRFNRYKDGAPLRTYSPVAHDDDLFLPTRHMGAKEIADKLADPSLTTPVDPSKVLRQAVAIAEAAHINAANSAATNPAAALAAGRSSSSSSGAVDGAEWTSMPLLDRGVLRQEQLRQQQERLAAKPKKQQPWQLMALDDYSFDLQQRPPTPSFDLLTAYLEVKYADVLLRKDAVKTLQRQMAVAALTSGGSATASEALETPPVSLTAATTLSPAEREGLVAALDEMLGTGQYKQYKEAVLQLYCDGLVSWGELQQCWAAAQAGEEMAAAEKAPVAFADDRQQLFALLSGQQQLGSLTSLTSSSSSGSAAAAKLSAADEAAARQAWEAAGKKLQGSWAAAAAAAHNSSSETSKPSQDVWAEPVSYNEAQQTWQQLLQLAGMPQGPKLEQVLLADSSDAVQQEQLQGQLQQLQQALQAATGLDAGAAAAAGIDDWEQLQQLFAAPPSLEEALKQHWEQVSQEHLGGKLKQHNTPTWQQLWQLLQALTAKQQRQQQGAAGAAGGAADAAMDATALFDQYLRESEAVPLTPPPYPGARRLLRWEQRMVLGPTSGQTVTSAETKVKLRVSAAELQQETRLSKKGLQHMLEVAGKRYNPETGMLSLSCDRFPTREENRRWCLEVLHRLLQEGQARHPSKGFLLGAAGGAAAQQAAATAALP